MLFLISICQVSQKIVAISSKCLQKFWHLRGRVNNGKFHSLVVPFGNIPLIITQLTGISIGDVADCQEFLVVGKEFIILMRYKLDDQGEIDQGGASHLIFVAHNGQSFYMPFL